MKEKNNKNTGRRPGNTPNTPAVMTDPSPESSIHPLMKFKRACIFFFLHIETTLFAPGGGAERG